MLLRFEWDFRKAARVFKHGVFLLNAKTMKKAKARREPLSRFGKDDILPEYDFSRARPNKYAARYRAGSSVVVLDPDVAAVFPNAAEVNEALRALAQVIRRHGPERASPRSR